MTTKERYELNHTGNVVVHESALCRRQNEMIHELFSQFAWQCDIQDSRNSKVVLRIKEPDADKVRRLTVYRGTIRNEDRNPYEKKMQLGSNVDPREEDKENTLILGIYVFNEDDALKDAVFVGLPIRDDINYPTNPSLRGGLFVNRLLKQAKTKGFIIDRENNLVGFRPEFIHFYLDNHYSIHYTSNSSSYALETNIDDVDANQHEGGIDLPRNLIYFGAPGTGKSFNLDKRASGFFKEESIRRVTFYPDYTYAQFVGCYKPISVPKSGQDDIPPSKLEYEITYGFEPGPFLETYRDAMLDPNNPHLLLIEEINRANPAAVFGDVFQLLDRSKSGESEYPVAVSKDVRLWMDVRLSEGASRECKPGCLESDYDRLKSIARKGLISIPSNMYIWATMNSADQGVYPMDTAFKRRWDFEYLGIDEGEDILQDVAVSVAGSRMDWNALRKGINKILMMAGVNEDKLIGPFFMKPESLSSDNFEDAFCNKVLLYLYEDAARMFRKKLFGDRTYSQVRDDFMRIGVAVFNDYEKIEYWEVSSENALNQGSQD